MAMSGKPIARKKQVKCHELPDLSLCNTVNGGPPWSDSHDAFTVSAIRVHVFVLLKPRELLL